LLLTLSATAGIFSTDRTERALKRVVLSINDPVSHTSFTKLSTNCLEGALFFPNFDRNFLAVSVEDSLSTLEESFQYFPIFFERKPNHFVNRKPSTKYLTF